MTTQQFLASALFQDAFPEIVVANAGGRMLANQTMKEVELRVRKIARTYLMRRGLLRLLPQLEDICQQFWLRVFGGRGVVQFDPTRGRAWSLLYCILRRAIWDVTHNDPRVKYLSLDLSNPDELCAKNVDQETMRAVRDCYLSLAGRERAAIRIKFPSIAKPEDPPCEIGCNEMVDRCRGLKRIRKALGQGD